LHAKPEDIARHRGQYRALGWDKLRDQRYARLQKSSLIDPRWLLAPRPSTVSPWDQLTPEPQDRWDENMSVYAAQIEEMDRGIGRVLTAVREIGAETNTLVFFLSDNGGAAENPKRGLPGSVLGTRESYEGYAIEGAHVSSSPFRKTKRFTHEGGIATPLIACWPAVISASCHGQLVSDPGHLIDLMPTCLAVAGASLPKAWNGANTTPLEGVSLLPSFRAQPLQRGHPLFWEHEGQRAARDGQWKLVASFNEPWELYDLEADRTELHNLITAEPERARELTRKYDAWAARVGVKPWPATPARTSSNQKKP
jgi:arylsulfatase